MTNCVFCQIDLNPNQQIILENEHCLFLQLNQSKDTEGVLEGAGVIVPRGHRETAFDLTQEEWTATYRLLQEVKSYLDKKHNPQGYNLGWNVGEVGGQHIFHAHFHVIPRYDNESLAGKGLRYLFKSEKNRRG